MLFLGVLSEEVIMISFVRISMISLLFVSVLSQNNAMRSCSNPKSVPNATQRPAKNEKPVPRPSIRIKKTDYFGDESELQSNIIPHLRRACSTLICKVPGFGTPLINKAARETAQNEISNNLIPYYIKSATNLRCYTVKEIEEKINEAAEPFLSNDFEDNGKMSQRAKEFFNSNKVNSHIGNFKRKCCEILSQVPGLGTSAVQENPCYANNLKQARQKITEIIPEYIGAAIDKGATHAEANQRIRKVSLVFLWHPFTEYDKIMIDLINQLATLNCNRCYTSPKKIDLGDPVHNFKELLCIHFGLSEKQGLHHVYDFEKRLIKKFGNKVKRLGTNEQAKQRAIEAATIVPNAAQANWIPQIIPEMCKDLDTVGFDEQRTRLEDNVPQANDSPCFILPFFDEV